MIVSSFTAVGDPNSLQIPSSLTSDNYQALLDMLLFKDRSSSNLYSNSLNSLPLTNLMVQSLIGSSNLERVVNWLLIFWLKEIP